MGAGARQPHLFPQAPGALTPHPHPQATRTGQGAGSWVPSIPGNAGRGWSGVAGNRQGASPCSSFPENPGTAGAARTGGRRRGQDAPLLGLWPSPLRPRERPWRPQKKACVQVRGLGPALVGWWPPRGRVSVKCLGLPPGPLQETLNPVQAHRASRLHPTPSAHGRLPAQPPCPRLPTRSDYLSAPQSPAWVQAAAPPHPETGLPSRLLAPEPWCCPAPAPAEAPPWMWTFLCYCEVLFMKNVEGEGSRPPEAGDPLPCTPTPFPAPAAPLPPQGAPQTSIALALCREAQALGWVQRARPLPHI